MAAKLSDLDTGLRLKFRALFIALEQVLVWDTFTLFARSVTDDKRNKEYKYT
jgi:hypothetical protein